MPLSTVSTHVNTQTKPCDDKEQPHSRDTTNHNGGNPAARNRNNGRPFAQSIDWDALEVLEADLVEEDDEPVDGFFSEKQQRLSTHPLYDSWPGPGDGRPFVAMANVGLFYDILKPPIVPDALLSVGVALLSNVQLPGHRSYTYWRYNKPPEVAIELVSNRKGNEDKDKKDIYAKAMVLFYIIFDRYQELGGPMMYVFKLNDDGEYEEYVAQGGVWWFPEINLGVRLWEGTYEDMTDIWLRWCYEDGQVVPTGDERAKQETEERRRAEKYAKQAGERAKQAGERAKQADERAKQADERAKQADERAKRLAEQLRALGIEPEL